MPAGSRPDRRRVSAPSNERDEHRPASSTHAWHGIGRNLLLVLDDLIRWQAAGLVGHP
jgi:hypothetical protein